MFDHGEAVVRNFLKNVPDGAYSGTGWIDDNGVGDEQIPVEVAVRVSGSNVIVDFSEAPAASPGPINCPLPSTVSSSRISIAMIAGGAAESANEGHFRALEVITRPGTMYHPVEPQPCFLYGWAIVPAMEAIFQALSKACQGSVPSGCSADIGAVIFSGVDSRTGKAFHGGNSLPCGHGASASGDGAILFIAALAHSQTQSPELQEAKLPIRYDRWEMLADTAGPGKFRGGSGWESSYTLLDPVQAIAIVEGQKSPGWAQGGGLPGTPNRLTVTQPGGEPAQLMKATDVKLPAGTRIQIQLGGGGGYGRSEERCKDAIMRDLRDGIVSEAHVREHYPQAFA
nr:hydantoinase B/oxoprolinase family protein [Sphingomonas sp. Y57]